MSENKSVFNWTFCQLLSEKPNCIKTIWQEVQPMTFFPVNMSLFANVKKPLFFRTNLAISSVSTWWRQSDLGNSDLRSFEHPTEKSAQRIDPTLRDPSRSRHRLGLRFEIGKNYLEKEVTNDQRYYFIFSYNRLFSLHAFTITTNYKTYNQKWYLKCQVPKCAWHTKC